MKKQKYTDNELYLFKMLDLLRDAEKCLQQIIEKDFYPENGVTKKSLYKYASDCVSDVIALLNKPSD